MIRKVIVLAALLAAGCGENGGAGAVFPDAGEDRVVFVNYWAEWCKPCREEIPELNAFQQAFADDIVLYGVNFDGVTGEELARQEQALGIEFETLAEDPGPRLGWPVPEGLPYTMVTDSRGEGLVQLPGKQTGESLRQALVEFRQQTEETP